VVRVGDRATQKAREGYDRQTDKLILHVLFVQSQVAYAMLYTVRLLTERAVKGNPGDVNDRLLIGFCLQALEHSRYRFYATETDAAAAAAADDDDDDGARGVITDREQAWLLSLETCVVDYVSNCDGDTVQDAVVLYINMLSSAVASQFYAAEYPLVLLELLCRLIAKTDRLKAACGRQLVHVCADVLLNLRSLIDNLTRGLLLPTYLF